MSVRCKFGFHLWKIRSKHRGAGLLFRVSFRYCGRCLRGEVSDDHCLGLSPPQYMYNWESVGETEDIIPSSMFKNYLQPTNREVKVYEMITGGKVWWI